MRKNIVLIFILLSLAFTYSCKKENPEIEKWKTNLLKKRAAEDKEFKTSPYSPIAGLDRLTASFDKKSFLVFQDGNFKLETKKTYDSLISVFKEGENWLLEVYDKDFQCKSSNEPIESGKKLTDDTKCKYKKYNFLVYPLDSNLIIVSFDPEKKEIINFTHRYYYPPNPNYRVRAKITRLENPKAVKMITSRNLIKTSYRYARLDFKIKGKKAHLFAYKKDLLKKPGEAILFIPFKDKTNGKDTYGAGRFLEIKEPVGDTLILDFNEAFNPLCNYSYVWNCSYPPPENTLTISIEAGEKKYPTKH